MLSFESAPNPKYFLGPGDGKVYSLTFPVEPDFYDEVELLFRYIEELDRTHQVYMDKLVLPVRDRIDALIGDYVMCKAIEYDTHGPAVLETWEGSPNAGLPFSLEYFIDSVFQPTLAIYEFIEPEQQIVIEDRMMTQLLSVMDRLCRNVLRHQLANPFYVIMKQYRVTIDDVRFQMENGRYAIFNFSTMPPASY